MSEILQTIEGSDDLTYKTHEDLLADTERLLGFCKECETVTLDFNGKKEKFTVVQGYTNHLGKSNSVPNPEITDYLGLCD